MARKEVGNELLLLRQYKARAPIDVVGLIEALGIEYSETPMAPDESGRIDVDSLGYCIMVNSLEGPQRRRFTAAHELGHYYLHRDMLDERGHLDRLFNGDSNNPASPFSEQHETQANAFAAELLMPAESVRALAPKHTPEELAKLFQVSGQAIKYRLKNLGLSA